VLPVGVWKELEAAVHYDGGYSAESPVIRHFWSVVHNDLSYDQRIALLAFVTGSSRMPLGGMSELRMIIQRAGPDGEMLPTASTCFHTLLLPDYASRDALKAKLLLALEHGGEGFGLQ
jgi:ubiquitin-protein ligase E3 A